MEVSFTQVVFGAPKWSRLESEDFVIISDANPKDMADFAVGYSAYRYAFRQLFVPKGRLAPSRVLLFRRASDFEKRVPEPKDGTSHMVSFTGEIEGVAVVAFPLDGDYEEALRIAYESETIWGLRRVGYAVPLWASQGAGEVLSSLRVRKGKCIIGAEPENLGGFPASWDAIPWPHFFEISTGSKEYSGPRATGKFHPQAWGLMHWVLLSEGGREHFKRIASRLEELSAPEVVPLVMDTPLKGFNHAIASHLSKGNEIELPFDEAAVRATFKVTSPSEAEVKVHLATLLSICGKEPEAYRELERARELEPQSYYVQEALGHRELVQNRIDLAAEHYRAAIAAGSKNPEAFLISARGRLNESSAGGADYAGGGGSNVSLALDEIHRVIEMDPLNEEAYVELGRAFFLAPQLTEENLEEVNTALGVMPSSSQLRYYHALLCERLKHTDEYLAELRHIAKDPSTPPQRIKQIEERLSVATLNAAVEKFNVAMKAQQFDEALSCLTAAQQSDSSHLQDKHYEALKESVEEGRRYAHLRLLVEDQNWTAFRKEAKEFLDLYPKSKVAPSLQRTMQVAERKEKAAAAKGLTKSDAGSP